MIVENNIEEIRDYVRLIGYVPNNDLPYLYNGAYMFLYTSKRESFGIPILESMACGTPVITGSVSAMPEIAGECGTLVDTFNFNDIADKMLELESSENIYNSAVDFGIERAKQFSWIKAAEETLNLYNREK